LGDAMVDILAYSLLPNHFHLVLRQRTENGITEFMRKFITAYTMYVNAKHDHSGVLFQGRFKSSHIDTESYFRWIFSYVHLNPLELNEPGWKEEGVRDANKARAFLRNYPYSSYMDYVGGARLESKLLSTVDIPDFLKEIDDLDQLLKTVSLNEKMEVGPPYEVWG